MPAPAHSLSTTRASSAAEDPPYDIVVRMTPCNRLLAELTCRRHHAGTRSNAFADAHTDLRDSVGRPDRVVAHSATLDDASSIATTCAGAVVVAPAGVRRRLVGLGRDLHVWPARSPVWGTTRAGVDRVRRRGVVPIPLHARPRLDDAGVGDVGHPRPGLRVRPRSRRWRSLRLVLVFAGVLRADHVGWWRVDPQRRVRGAEPPSTASDDAADGEGRGRDRRSATSRGRNWRAVAARRSRSRVSCQLGQRPSAGVPRSSPSTAAAPLLPQAPQTTGEPVALLRTASTHGSPQVLVRARLDVPRATARGGTGLDAVSSGSRSSHKHIPCISQETPCVERRDQRRARPRCCRGERLTPALRTVSLRPPPCRGRGAAASSPRRRAQGRPVPTTRRGST